MIGSASARRLVAAVCMLIALPASAARQHGADWGLAYLGHPTATVVSSSPSIAYSSYFGGGMADEIAAVRVNAAGEVYIAGTVDYGDLPTTPGADQTFGGQYDGFVAKFSADGHTLLYSTYLGTQAVDFITGLALDDQGNAYAVGYTQPTIVDAAQAFVAKIVDSGGALSFTVRQFGGPDQAPNYGGDDRATDIAIKGDNVYVVGTTTSAIGFTTLDPISSTLGGTRDGFIQRYDHALILKSSTYFGGPGAQEITGIDVGPSGNITICGADFGNGIDPTVWVARLDGSVSTVLWSKDFVGDVRERALDVRIRPSGHAMVTGWTESTNYASLNGLDQSYGGNVDAFLLVANNDGTLNYASYVGGAGVEYGRAIELAPNNDVWILGDTQAVVGNTQSADVFVVRFNDPLGTNRTLDYSAHFGSGARDFGNAMARGPNGALWLAGTAGMSDFPIAGDAYIGIKEGTQETYFMRLYDGEDDSDRVFAGSFESAN